MSGAQVLKDVIGVYSSHPSGPLSLSARTKVLSEEMFLQLDQDKLALRMPAMRFSVHLLPSETAYKVFAATIPSTSDPVWEKRYSQKGRIIPKGKYENWNRQVLQQAKIPITVKEIKQSVDIPDEKIKLVLNRMAFEGSLLRIGADSLCSNIISYVSAKTWAGEFFSSFERNKALIWLASEYLRAFGPAREKDFQWWVGITAGQAKHALSALDTIDIGNSYLLLAKDLDDFESFKIPLGDSVDLLPQWDSYTMGYAPDGRERFVSSDVQQLVYGKLGATGGNALGTVLINGLACGVWNHRFRGNQMQISLHMFEKPSNRLKDRIYYRFNEIASFLAAKHISIEAEL